MTPTRQAFNRRILELQKKAFAPARGISKSDETCSYLDLCLP
jgi:hypothetical protein